MTSERGGEVVPVLDLDQAHVALVALKARESSMSTVVVGAAGDDEHGHAHVGPAAPAGVHVLGVDGEAEVDLGGPLLLVVLGGQPARLPATPPGLGAEAAAPALHHPEGRRQEHQRAHPRVLLGHAAGGEAAQARPEEHRPVLLAPDGRARGGDHRREAQVLERGQAQVEAIHRHPPHVVVVAEGRALVRAGARGEAVEVEEARTDCRRGRQVGVHALGVPPLRAGGKSVERRAA